MTSTRWHTYSSAAKRVGRSRRTIRHWHAQGMPMSWQRIEGQQTRVVREDVLMKWFRDRLKASPMHYSQMRKIALEQGLPAPKKPAWMIKKGAAGEKVVRPTAA